MTPFPGRPLFRGGKEIEAWTGVSGNTTKPNATTDTLYGYDLFGRLASVTAYKQNGSAPTVPIGVAVYAPFDAAGHALPTAGLPTTLYQYDAAGNLTKILDPNNTETDYTIDPVHDTQTTTNKVTSTAGTLSSYVYQLDADGRKTTETDKVYATGNTTPFSTNLITWTYDSLSRLIKEVYDYGNDDTPTSGHTTADYTVTYAYDLAGNRVEKTLDTSSDGTIDESTAYSYVNPANQEKGNNELYSAVSTVSGTTAYTYDNNGSMKTQVVTNPAGTTTESDTYVYDARNRLINATVGGTMSSDTYNDDGNRVSETTSGTATTLMNDVNNPSGFVQVLEEHPSSGSAATYLIGISGVTAQNAGGTVSYLLPDGHGSTRILIDSAGNTQGYYDYDAFGKSISPGDPAITGTAATTKYQYTGQQWDASTNGYFLRGRPIYDPRIGRFTTMDARQAPVGDLTNANLYVYLGANPLNMVDPTGHAGLAELTTVISIIAFLITVGSFTNTANAPGPNDPIYPDTGGDLVIGAAIDITSIFVAGKLLQPLGRQVFRVSSKALRALSDGIRGEFAMLRFGEGVSEIAESSARQQLSAMQAANTNAHFLSLHGADTSIDSQFERATTGITPTGRPGSPVDASRFYTNSLQLQAARQAETIFSQTGQTAFDFDMGQFVGEGFTRGGGQYVVTSNVTAVFRNGKLFTMYPKLSVLK